MISDAGSVDASYVHALWMSTRTYSNGSFALLLTGNVALGLLLEGFRLYLVNRPRRCLSNTFCVAIPSDVQIGCDDQKE